MSGFKTDAVILCWNAPAQADLRAQKVVAQMGIGASVVAIDASALGAAASIDTLVPRSRCLVVNATTLVKAADAAGNGSGLSALTDGVADHVFIYGFEPTE